MKKLKFIIPTALTTTIIAPTICLVSCQKPKEVVKHLFTFDGENCTIFNDSKYSQEIEENTEAKFTVEPAQGYALADASGDGWNLTHHILTIAKMDKDYHISLKATLGPSPVITYTFTFTGIDCSIFNQTIYSKEIQENTTDYFTVEPIFGYDLADTSGDGWTLTSHLLTISQITKPINITLTATKHPDPFETHTLTFKGTSCTVGGKSEYTTEVIANQMFQLAITPDRGYFVSQINSEKWNISNQGVLTIPSMDADYSIEVTATEPLCVSDLDEQDGEVTNPTSLYIYLKNPQQSGILTSYDGINWNSYSYNEDVPPEIKLDIKDSTVPDKIYIRNIHNTLNTQTDISCSLKINSVNTTNKIPKASISGNIMSLVNFTNLTAYCFQSLFKDSANLSTAADLLLPVDQLQTGCYEYMFQNCSNLTSCPELPATHLAPSCYYEMFANCVSLDKIPYLPASTLADHCYGGMFLNNLKLIITKNKQGTEEKILDPLPQEAFKYESCSNMFYGCVLSNFLSPTPEPEQTYSWDYEENVPLYFTSSSDFAIGYEITGELPNINMQYSIDNINWYDWDGLPINVQKNGKLFVRNPKNTLSLSQENYLTFFPFDSNWEHFAHGNCQSLVNFNNYAFSYTFYNLFYNFQNLVSAPCLPLEVVPECCYANMFTLNLSLLTVPEIKAKNFGKNACLNMFGGCRSLICSCDFSQVAEIDEYSFEAMFFNCTSLKVIKPLPNLDLLPIACYIVMFDGCEKLKVQKTTDTQIKNKIFTCPEYSSEPLSPVSGMFINTKDWPMGTEVETGYTYYWVPWSEQ